jgi:hypothetical protein
MSNKTTVGAEGVPGGSPVAAAQNITATAAAAAAATALPVQLPGGNISAPQPDTVNSEGWENNYGS